MKKDDLVKVIRAIVKQEIKKELPTALAQVFAQMMGQAQQPQIHSINMVRNIAPSTPPVPQPVDPVDEMASLKSQLQEMFQGGSPVSRAAAPPAAPPMRQFAKDPVLNEILNQTRGFNSSERMAGRASGMGGGMSPAVAMAAGAYQAPQVATTGVGELMDGSELGFLNKIPGMPGADAPVITQLPTSRGMVQEGHAPLEALGNVSALDLKNHPALPASIKGILTRDYRSLVRAMDKKK